MKSTEYRGAMIEGPRAARVNELSAVVRLANEVFYPNSAVDMGRVLPTLFSEANAANLRIFVDDGTPVALSGITVQDIRMENVAVRTACLGSVCTSASHRGRGLAARLVDDCVDAALTQGASLLLVSGGRGLYRRMGCIDAGLFAVIRVRLDSRLPPVSCRVREWTEADVPEVEALHAREPVRFVRAPGEMRSLLRTRALHVRPARTWIVRVGERTTAYLCVSGPDEKTGPGALVAREIAGSRHAVLAAAPAITKACQAESLDIEVPASDEMAVLADSFGCESRTAGMHGTLKIIEPARFFQALRPRFQARLSLEDRRALSSNDAISMAAEDLAAFVFGSIEREPPRVLHSVFPLPLPAYGLNYV
jgi:GNAT superfamily N-acetyltransferase